MGSGNFYSRVANFNENAKRNRVLRGGFLAGVLLLGMQLTASAQVFTGGSTQSLTVCENTSLNDIGSVMIVNDPSTATPSDNFNMVAYPSNGTTVGFPASYPTGGITNTTGTGHFTYTPNTGFSGSDQFIISVSNGGAPVYDTINVTVNPLPALTLVNPNASICAGTGSVSFSYTGLTNVGPVSNVFSSAGTPSAPYVSWTVPAGITALTFVAEGATGGVDNYGGTVGGTPQPGAGGYVSGFMSVTPGEVLNVFVGGQGSVATPGDTAYGGYNGGGNAYYYPLLGSGGGTGGAGGGASDIRVGGTSLANRVVVAGGGGGTGWDSPYGEYYGGAGGDSIGGNSQANVGGSSAGGGAQISGGAAAVRASWTSGENGSLGQGGDGSMFADGGGGISGGGGGGYYGGGGGVWNGGGGGSSYTDPSTTSLITERQGYNNGGNGIVSVTYNIPGTYTITWNSAATTAGFTDTTATLPAGAITANVPATAPAGTYTGSITVNITGGCSSVSYPITITVNPNPDVTTGITNLSACNGSSITPAPFNGDDSGATYNWTSDNTSFGIPSGGTVGIPTIMVNNSTTAQEVANITVTPVLGMCTGTPQHFQITANPTPMLSNANLSSNSVCSGTAFNYMDSSATVGTTYTWTRAAVSGITPATGGGSTGNMTETLTNTSTTPTLVTYMVTLTFTATTSTCTNTQNVNLTVNPTPNFSSGTTAFDCDSTAVTYMATSAVSPVTFTWNRNVVTGITSSAASGTGATPAEVLYNASANPVNAIYNYTATTPAGCTASQNVSVTVAPKARLTPQVVAPVCSGNAFSYTPTSATFDATFSWVNTTPALTTGPASGSYSIGETLTNTTANPVMATYIYTVSYLSCPGTTATVNVMVNPKPTLNSTLTPNAICDNVPFNYTATSATTGASISWNRPIVAGISTGAADGLGNVVDDLLTNTTNAAIPVTYDYTVTYNGCSSMQDVTVMVNPSPVFTSSLDSTMCDSMKFNYTPKSSTVGATFNWTRAYQAGILAPATSGTGNPDEKLINTTNVSVNATYQYTASYNGCSSNPVDVVVTVRPEAKLSSSSNGGEICTNGVFNYTPSSYTPGVFFNWYRAQVTGITPNSSYDTSNLNGAGIIAETLTNNTNAPIHVQYEYQLTAYGCTNPTPEPVNVIVNPAPAGAMISPGFASNVCSGAQNQIFGAVTAPANGVKYTWSSNNGTIWSTTQGEQYILVNFNNPGEAVITLTSTSENSGCNGSSSVTVNVGSTEADNPGVIYYQGMFVCLNNEEQSYQWGYDNAVTFQSTYIQNAINQAYIDPNADFTDNNYWVITTNNGCTQKTYYNPPKATATHRNSASTLTVYPNPVGSVVNLAFSNAGTENMEYEVVNMLGQKLITGTAPEAGAAIDASNLAPACYLINCYHDGVKIATTKFIKN